MTEKEKIIATAYTGIMFVEGKDLGKVYDYEEEKLGHGVIDIMHANEEFNMKVREAVKEDFIAMLQEEPVSKNKNLVMLNELEQKVARVLWPGIDVRTPWTTEGRNLVQKNIAKLKEIFKEETREEQI